MKILVATNNLHKIKEIKEIVARRVKLKIEFITPKDLNIVLEPEEIGTTFFENAKIKAEAFYSLTKLPVLADDSGLEVKILNGMPGVSSARFAEAHNDAANRQKLLKLLESTDNREARFVTVAAFYSGQNTQILFFEGECKGKIIRAELGEGGFGYDPIFVPNGYGKTFAELDELEKNQISHRANAIYKFCDFLNAKYFLKK